MDKKTVFIDLDGTIVYDVFTVYDSSRVALRKLKENGHDLFVCSGRNKPLVEALFGNFFDDGVYAAGGYVEYNGEAVIEEYFREEEKKILEDFAKRYDAVRSCMCRDRIYSEGWVNEFFNRKAGNIEASKDNDMSSYKGEKIYKCDIRFFLGMEEAFEEAKKDEALTHFSWSTYPYNPEMGNTFEISRKGVSKGTAILKLADLGIVDLSNTICIGDSMNDYEMMKVCAFGVAMGNAEEALKKRADMVTDSIENDGFRKAFETLGMI